MSAIDVSKIFREYGTTSQSGSSIDFYNCFYESKKCCQVMMYSGLDLKNSFFYVPSYDKNISGEIKSWSDICSEDLCDVKGIKLRFSFTPTEALVSFEVKDNISSGVRHKGHNIIYHKGGLHLPLEERCVMKTSVDKVQDHTEVSPEAFLPSFHTINEALKSNVITLDTECFALDGRKVGYLGTYNGRKYVSSQGFYMASVKPISAVSKGKNSNRLLSAHILKSVEDFCEMGCTHTQVMSAKVSLNNDFTFVNYINKIEPTFEEYEIVKHFKYHKDKSARFFTITFSMFRDFDGVHNTYKTSISYKNPSRMLDTTAQVSEKSASIASLVIGDVNVEDPIKFQDIDSKIVGALMEIHLGLAGKLRESIKKDIVVYTKQEEPLDVILDPQTNLRYYVKGENAYFLSKTFQNALPVDHALNYFISKAAKAIVIKGGDIFLSASKD
uniref:NSs protein n=1 Tax=Lisianthus necrotic ringspot virus TaxID=1398661 RepID=T2HWH1_9VIRU|nr:NSs [Lisianthus necrotic ringspot virus]